MKNFLLAAGFFLFACSKQTVQPSVPDDVVVSGSHGFGQETKKTDGDLELQKSSKHSGTEKQPAESAPAEETTTDAGLPSLNESSKSDDVSSSSASSAAFFTDTGRELPAYLALKKREDLCQAVAAHYGIAVGPNDFSACFRVGIYCFMVRINNHLGEKRYLKPGVKVKTPAMWAFFKSNNFPKTYLSALRSLLEAESTFYSAYEARLTKKQNEQRLKDVLAALNKGIEGLSAPNAAYKVPKSAIHQFTLAAQSLGSVLNSEDLGHDYHSEMHEMVFNRRFSYGLGRLIKWTTKYSDSPKVKCMGKMPMPTGSSCRPNRK